MSMKQGEAVFKAVSKVFNTAEGAAVPETGKWTEEQKQTVYATVLGFFKSGECPHSKNPTEAELIKYIPGLVNNWVRKDKRLNGGIKYETKRPGARSGSGDEMVKEMRKLLSVTMDPGAKAQIQEAIDARLEQLKPKVEINATALPESLRHLVA